MCYSHPASSDGARSEASRVAKCLAEDAARRIEQTQQHPVCERGPELVHEHSGYALVTFDEELALVSSEEGPIEEARNALFAFTSRRSKVGGYAYEGWIVCIGA